MTGTEVMCMCVGWSFASCIRAVMDCEVGFAVTYGIFGFICVAAALVAGANS